MPKSADASLQFPTAVKLPLRTISFQMLHISTLGVPLRVFFLIITVSSLNVICISRNTVQSLKEAVMDLFRKTNKCHVIN